MALLLAGCAGPPRHNYGNVPDWESSISSSGKAVSSSKSASPVSRPSGQTTTPSTATPGGKTNAASTGQPATSGWVPLARWSRESGAAVFSQLTGPAPTYCLRSPQGALLLRPGSLSAQWDGLELRLGFAPQMIADEPCAHALDLSKTIQPLLDAPTLSLSGLVVIDPGHGGPDCGAQSVLGSGCEKDLALDWAKRLRDVLIRQGCQASLTRDSDSELALSNRVAFAVERRAALFVSLHFNSAAPNHSESGVETYCLTPAGMPSSLVRGFADDTSQVFPNNAFDADNIAWAVRIHRALLQANGQQDRGVRRARFPTVLRGQQCPAVLLEGGYLSNPDEARLIADPAYRQKLAEAVARALLATPAQQ